MIELNVKDYCQNCPGFYPVGSTVYGDDGTVITIVKCSESNKCEHIAAIIRKQLEKEQNNDQD